MGGFWEDFRGDFLRDPVGRLVAGILVLIFAGLVTLGVIAAHQPPDPPGTTYTYEDTILCQNTIASNGQVGIVCLPTVQRVPHYPTPAGR